MTMITDWLDKLEALEKAATLGPWTSTRDGNQFIETDYLPTAKPVGASRLAGVKRPWNPYALISFGFRPTEYETARFKDADADLIAAVRNSLPRLLRIVRAAEALYRSGNELQDPLLQCVKVQISVSAWQELRDVLRDANVYNEEE